ncbi:MAG: hypothetical protein WAO55_15955 [Candidatus Manganitrophaceae bacterium]
MNNRIYLLMIAAMIMILGNTVKSSAGCLMNCEGAVSESETEEIPNQEQRKEERTQQFGDLRDSVVVSGVEMSSSNQVSVGSNSGDVNTTSSTIIMGVNKSYNNTTNTTTQNNR